MTPCECKLAGWCERHRRNKSDRMLHLCQTDIRYWASWEERNDISDMKPPKKLKGVEYNHWMPLHYYAIKRWNSWNIERAKKYLAKWESNIPGGTCSCKDNWKKEIKDIPPQFDTPRLFFEWSWLIHDTINARLGKSYRPTLTEAYAIWAHSTDISPLHTCQSDISLP